jgi:predicted enzyme related to lactoylglutathione lyase
MKELITFFEIPTLGFERAVAFYEHFLNVKLELCDCGEEKMAFFPTPDSGPRGAISLARGFDPSPAGVLIHFATTNLDASLARVLEAGGKVRMPKTRIEAGDQGFFALVNDPDGNTIGLHQPAI